MAALLVYAFTLGLVAAVNPCGFALLPVYLSSFARAGDGPASLGHRLTRAVGAAGVVSGGFAVVFGAVGAAVSAGAAAVVRWAPWAMIVIAAAMVAVGGAMLARRRGAAWLLRVPLRVRGRSLRSMFVFGVGYGLASLSCALPVFLAGVAGVFLRADLLSGLVAFLAYALGMATVLTALSVAITFGWGRAARLRRLSRYADPLGGLLLVVVGAYLLYYWVTALVAPVRAFPLTRMVESVQAGVAGWLGGAGVWVGVGVAASVCLLLVAVWLTRNLGARTAIPLTLLLPGLLVPAGLLGASAPATTSGGGDAPTAATPRLSTDAQLLTSYTPLRTARPAPGFTLTDQRGRRVSLEDLRGKVVVLAFMDPRGTGADLLYSRDMLAAARDLGGLAREVAFVGVNVNPFHTRVADVATFTRRTHLSRLPRWYFLTGSPDELRKVWRDYGAAVLTRGRAVHHRGTIYVIDRRGRERATMAFGGSSDRTQRWGHAMATVVAGLLGAPAPADTHGPSPGGDGPGITVAGEGSAPAFRLPRLRRPAEELALADLTGKPTVINFWASWCPPCRRELPTLQEAAARWRGQVNIVGIDINDRRGSALRTAKAAGTTYPLLFDRAGEVAQAYRVVNLPTTVFISADGRVVARHTGAMSRTDLARAIRTLASAGRGA